MNADRFIDLHIHGTGRFETRTDDYRHLLRMSELQWNAGTAAILPTVYSGPVRVMREHMAAVRKAMEIQSQNSGSQGVSGVSGVRHKSKNRQAIILGLHLEGPFLNPAYCGAQDKKSLIRPARSSLKKLIEGFEEIVKIITVAPELPGALKVIETCTAIGIRINMGHSGATYRQALEGKKAGATGITHIFNAMRPFHHREPSIAGLGFFDEELYIEVIADGIHLHPKTVEFIFRNKPCNRIMLVSDSVKSLNRKKDAVYNKDGSLAGSCINLQDSVRILKKIGIPLNLIIKAARDNPAKYLGLRFQYC